MRRDMSVSKKMIFFKENPLRVLLFLVGDLLKEVPPHPQELYGRKKRKLFFYIFSYPSFVGAHSICARNEKKKPIKRADMESAPTGIQHRKTGGASPSPTKKATHFTFFVCRAAGDKPPPYGKATHFAFSTCRSCCLELRHSMKGVYLTSCLALCRAARRVREAIACLQQEANLWICRRKGFARHDAFW